MTHRVEQIGPCTLYLGDCADVLQALDHFDCIVTDPPYGVSMKRGDSRINEAIQGDKTPPAVAWMAKHPAIIWGGNNFCDQLPRNTGWLIWDKGESPKSHHSMAELAWCNVVRTIRVHSQAFRGFMATAARDSDRVHPTQKPVKLMRWCLSLVAGETVCDPYMGSGSTGVACIMDGRKFIGIEIDETYFDIACKRIRKAWQEKRSELPLEVTHAQT